MTSALGSMTTGDSVDSLLCFWTLSCQYIYLLYWENFKCWNTWMF